MDSSVSVGPRNDVEVLVAGYASIDVIYRACASPKAGATTLLHGPVVSAPRCGGCGPGTAVALARAGCRVGLVTWLGDDREGQACLENWIDAGVDRRGVVVATGQGSPRSFLFYDPAGGATCYYHPSGSAALRLTAPGRELLSGARALAVTVGPAALTRELLAARRPDQPLAWNVKADANAFPPDLRRHLVREAAVICLNRDELPFVTESLPGSEPLTPSIAQRGPAPRAQGEGSQLPATRLANAPLPAHRAGHPLGGGWGEGRVRQRPASSGEPSRKESDITAMTAAIQRHSGGIVVVTAGAAGCRVVWPGGVSDVPVVPVQVADPTGAGDAFFGVFVAGWLRGADPEQAAVSASEYVAAFLRERAAGEEDG